MIDIKHQLYVLFCFFKSMRLNKSIYCGTNVLLIYFFFTPSAVLGALRLGCPVKSNCGHTAQDRGQVTNVRRLQEIAF